MFLRLYLLTHIRDEITEQLDVVPQMTFRVVHIRKQYACKGCEETMRLAKLPKRPLNKSIATPGLLAAVIDAKFNRHMPLYRQEAMFAEAGISVTRATLSHWLIHAAYLLTLLVKLMEADIQEYNIAFADETTVQVLQEKDRLPHKNPICGYLLAARLQRGLLFTNTTPHVPIKYP